MLATAERLRPDQLSERLPLRGSGDELDRLSATINGLLDRLAEHLGRQREFMANAAHELRSPLAALRTSIEVALDRERGAEEYRELLADLVEECAALGILVNQLLRLAENDAGKLQPGDSRVRLDELVVRSVEMFRGAAEQKGVELRGPSPPPVSRAAMPSTFARSSTICWTTPSSSPRPAAASPWRWRRGRPRSRLRVEDTGSGIAAKDLPHVFVPFYRADKSRQRPEWRRHRSGVDHLSGYRRRLRRLHYR